MQAYMAPEFYRVVVNDLFLTKPVVTLQCVKCLKRLCSDQGKFEGFFAVVPRTTKSCCPNSRFGFLKVTMINQYTVGEMHRFGE